MSKNNRMLSSGYSFEVCINNIAAPEPGELLRISENDTLNFKLRLEEQKNGRQKYENVLLHTNIINGKWSYLSFKKEADDFLLEINKPAGGRASFRFVVENENELYWEPDNYHELLVDPATMDFISLYTLIPNVSGRLSLWEKKLADITAMGFNTVHLLPVTAMGSSESPYSAADLFDIDKIYCENIDEFRSFSKAAAGLNIKLCLDIVLNHISNENCLCSEHAEWIVPDKTRADGMKRAGCYHHDSWISWEDLVLLNYDHPDPDVRKELYEYMLSYVIFWINAAGGDNIMLRLDNLHSSDKNFIKWLLPEIRRIYPGIIILSEYFGAEYHLDEAVLEYGLNLLTANSWEYPFAPVLQKYISGIHNSGKLCYLISPTSHDTETAAKLFGRAESSIPRYAVCALMGTGKSGIVQGFEYGQPEKINFIGRHPEPTHGTKNDFSDFIRRINSLVKDQPCLRRKGNIEFFDTGNDSLIVCRRRGCDGRSILTAVNLDIYNEHSMQYHILEKTETLIEENAETEYIINEDLIKIKLGACGVCVIRTKR